MVLNGECRVGMFDGRLHGWKTSMEEMVDRDKCTLKQNREEQSEERNHSNTC